MKEIIVFIAIHFVACILFFAIVQRSLFFLYNKSLNNGKIRFFDLRNIYAHGAVTDLIGASYLTAIPTLLLWALSYFHDLDTYQCVIWLDIPLSIVVALVTISDTVLYKFWQFKIDSSVFSYLRNVKAAFASVSALYILLCISAVMVVCAVSYLMMLLSAQPLLGVKTKGADGWLGYTLITASFLLICATLFAVIRGIHHRPNNPCVAYYSKNPFFNHCALNPLYSLIYSLSIKDDYEGQFQTFEKEECARDFAPLFPTSGTPQTQLLNTQRPNILFIIWESLSARYIKTLGGEDGVMPEFEHLAEEGVLFTRCDCGSFRTDRGLVCLLSGCLGQPTASVIKHTRKLPHLPALPRRLREEGYETLAVHGGNCQVMHKTDYYLATGHDKLLQMHDLPNNAPRCAWGINDGYMFNWLYDDIQQKTEQKKLWYTTFQTLNSHEPFDVPYHKLADEKKNAFAYVDHYFGEFIEKLKASPAWDNLLVVCTGDHGFNYQAPITRDKFCHIPILLLGGAIKRPMKIDKIVAQTDIAATLLGQMGLRHDEFKFSRDVLADTYTYPFALHTYNNGFLFRDETGFTNYDNVVGHTIEGHDPEREHKAKVILQTLYEYLSKIENTPLK